MAAHQASLSLGFSRQEHWSGLPFPSPMHESEKWKWSHSVVSDSSDPMDCSLPGSSIHGIFQSKVLKLVAIAFSENYPGYHQLVKSWSQFASSFGVLASTNQHNIWYSMFNNWSGKHIPFDPHHMKEPQANLFCMWISLLPFTIYCSPQEFLSVIQTDKLQHMGQI